MSRFDTIGDVIQALTILLLILVMGACALLIGHGIFKMLPPFVDWIETGGWMR